MSTRNTSKFEDTYKSVWDTLSGVDCSEYVEKKNGLSFLSWAWAWGILMEYYPKATYSFSPPIRDEFGTVEVWCTVKIGDLERRMWLPVMDYKNNAIKNPDYRKISDTRMRCLTKCLAMFGLGHYIYAGEDIPSKSEEPAEQAPPKAAEKPVEKPAAKKAPAKKEKPIETSEHSIPDAESAENTVNFMCDTVDQFHADSMESLAGFWKENKQLIDLLDASFPEQYQRLKAHFTHTKQQLLEGDAS